MPSDEMVEKVARAKELIADIVNLPHDLRTPFLRCMEQEHPETLAQLRAALAAAEAGASLQKTQRTQTEAEGLWAKLTPEQKAAALAFDEPAYCMPVDAPAASPPSEVSRDERAAIRKEAFEEAAMIGYRICAETRHVTLGDRVEAAIRAGEGEKG